MAVDTPELERITVEEEKSYSVPSRMEILAEEEHNARIKDNYARLINPQYKIEDVFKRAEEKSSAAVIAPAREQQPYRVENARANSEIFRADSAINAQRMQTELNAAVSVYAEEDNEDLRPTPTTIQYQTIGVKKEESATAAKRSAFVIGKREKIIIAVFVAVVVALVTLVLVNASIISNLNAEIAKVQDSITAVSGAIKGLNSSVGVVVEEIVNGSLN